MYNKFNGTNVNHTLPSLHGVFIEIMFSVRLISIFIYKFFFQSVQIKSLPTVPLVFANSSIENPGDILFQELSSRCHNSHSLAKSNL